MRACAFRPTLVGSKFVRNRSIAAGRPGWGGSDIVAHFRVSFSIFQPFFFFPTCYFLDARSPSGRGELTSRRTRPRECLLTNARFARYSQIRLSDRRRTRPSATLSVSRRLRAARTVIPLGRRPFTRPRNSRRQWPANSLRRSAPPDRRPCTTTSRLTKNHVSIMSAARRRTPGVSGPVRSLHLHRTARTSSPGEEKTIAFAPVRFGALRGPPVTSTTLRAVGGSGPFPPPVKL